MILPVHAGWTRSTTRPARPDPADFGPTLRRILGDEGITQTELGIQIDRHSSTVNGIVRGREAPALEVLARIVAVLPAHRDALIAAALHTASAQGADRSGAVEG